MMKRKSLIIFAIFISLWAQPAMAYIEPGTGSAIISAIIGFSVAIGITVKTYWYKIKSVFTGKKASKISKDDQTSDLDE